MVSAKVIAHSKAPNGEELITLEIELHRFVLPEFNTHRSLSRNFQSSRAVPIKKMIEQVRNNPATPVHWGKNQRGMVAEQKLNEEAIKLAEDSWFTAAYNATVEAERLDNIGAHKETVNRLLEPFMWTKGVVTATREAFEAFFALRCHKDAQPEIQALAFRMRDAIENSVPDLLQYGQYHLPYVPKYDEDGNPSYYDDPTDAIKVSVSCCAQVSYRALDDSLDKAKKIFDMLNFPENGVYKDEPAHFSPAEHVAKVVNQTTTDKPSGNFHSRTFWQYRKALEIGKEFEFIS